MADKADFTMQAHDRLPVIRGTAGGDVGDLTNAQSVKFIMRAADQNWEPIFTGAAKVNAAAVIIAPASQKTMEYQWATGDTDTPGMYVGQFQIIWTAGSKPQTVPTETYVTIQINADLDNA